MEKSFLKLKDKILIKDVKICVIGLGYVGLNIVKLLLNKNYKVIGYDTSVEKINLLKKGISYNIDIKSEDIREHIGKNFFPTNIVNDLKEGDIFIVSVPTPLNEVNQPELKFVYKAIRDIRKSLTDESKLIIFESTLPPGTTEEVILPKLKKSKKNFLLCFSPERINPGSNYEIEKIPKVISGIDEDSLSIGLIFYSTIFESVIPVSSTKVAEYIKLLENSYRFINISFINELAKLTSLDNVDIFEVIEGAKTKPYGFTPFYPNWGVGGDCIPTVPMFLVERGRKFGYKVSLIEYSFLINKSMPLYWFDKVKKHIKKSVFILGITYKKDVNDTRNSQVLKFAEILINKGYEVSYYDPYIKNVKVFDKKLKSIEPTLNRLKKYDLIVIGTDHSQLPYEKLLKLKIPILDPYGKMPKSKYVISF